MNSNPRLGVYVPEWQAAAGRPAALSGEWTLLTVHADLAAAPTPMPIMRVDLAAMLEWLRRHGGRARVMHLRHAVEAMDCEAAAIDGLLRTAALEYPNLIVRSVRLDGGDVATVIAKETRLDASGFQQTLWRSGERFEGTWQETEGCLDDGTDRLAIDGTVLITGGLGGVGRRIAEHLATRPGMRLALVGRSALHTDAKAWIENLPAKAVHFRADVADRQAAVQLIADVERQLGPIAGVVHAAGHLEDAWIANVDPAALARVLAKAHGALNLDAALAGHASLRWFVLCSSLAGTLGHVGQGAYAAANAWVDHVAEAREHLRAQGQRFGVTRAIAWPLWAEGGMRPAPETLATLHDAGLAPLPTPAAMMALAQSLTGVAPVAAVLWGDVASAVQKLGLRPRISPDLAAPHRTSGHGAKLGADALIAALAPLGEQLLKLPAGRLDPDRALSAYGFDSITLTRFSAAIRDRIGGPNLAPATFLDHPTLRSLATHLAGQIGGPVEVADIPIERPLATNVVAASTVSMKRTSTALGAFSLLERVSARATTPVAEVPKPNERNPDHDAKIAVVGIGCRFPGAEGAVALWRNLCEGHRAITHVPEERWDWRAIDGDPNASGNRTDCHLGGFITDVASFDAGLFGLSDDEARTMDPQHRLVLEAAWTMLEDAGIGPDALNGRKVGAFVGVQRQEYQTRLAAETMTGGVNTGNSRAMLVNRLSYLFGWTGPSLAIDTGCSGSAVAIHQAVRALQSGECSHAVAGGVNVVLAPESVIVNRRMGLLTGSDTVRPFDASADGHLFADGVGLVLLRRLDDAVADGDFVYGVIAGSATNHNGEAMYLTAPSPRGQAEAMREAFARANLMPSNIDYVEGQGAANTLVDGAELDAYRQVFAGRRIAMPLGSLKGHLGHLESASGVAALIKVLMAMRSGVLPPTLGHQTLNWDVARGPAPVTVVTERQAWPDDGDRVRRAGVHNFGYGGANVHLVVESGPIVSGPADDGAVVVVPLSAPSGPQLQASAADLARFLKAETWRAFGFEHLRLADVAYTLQTGRRPQAVRAAFAVTSLTDLVAALERFAAGDAASDPWPSGGTVDWNTHRGVGPHRRLPLPGTPFARRRFWPTAVAVTQGAVGAYYDALARSMPQLAAREEMNLLFAPLPERPAGFSWLRTLFLPEEQPEHFRLFVDRQRAMKARLFDWIDLARVRRVMDIGCGFATDLLQLANANPLLTGRGFTIAPAQAALAARRIDEASLGNRVEVLARDSARDDMGGPYDLMIGFEVTFHVADKAGLFGNIVRNLSDDGDLLLIDCVAETASDISMPEIGQFTPTSSEFAQVLAAHGLAIVHADDASGGVANFLHDPDFEEHLDALHARLPALAERAGEHRGWANFGKALSLGLLRYVLLHVHKDARGVVELAAHNRHALAQAKPYEAPRPVLANVVPERLAGGSLEERVAAVTAALADMTVEALPRDARFAALGITSLKGLQLVDALSRHLGMPVRMTDLFDYPSVRSLAAHLSAQAPKAAAVTMPVKPAAVTTPDTPPFAVHSNDIAIIGLAARFPGADDIQAFWRNLRDGVDSVGPLPSSRRTLTGSATDHEAGFLDGVDQFDPLFFRLTPREAEAMDPQQRLFLEQCWHAIEDAGIAPSRLRGANCGVVAGVQPSEYGDLFGERAFDSHAAQLLLGNAASILASRIAYLLDLKGPAISLDTACSSSLVAVHQAARMLRDRQADLMLAGGVSLFLSDKPFRMMERAGMLAPGGRCRPFSDRADGIAVAEGAGVVVLKRLTEALADGDRIWGMIRGSAINQDGATNGITAPSRDSQRRLAQAALKDAGLDANAIDYVEAHGTGTSLGDPIEIAALSDVYGRGKTEAIGLGAVKSNIGHASAASGIAGLTKVLLSLAHDQIPPTLHLDAVNPHIRLDETPFRIPRTSEPWRRNARPRRAVVNSLGFSGTNCHVVVEEAPARVGAVASDGLEIFLLSARTDVALRACVVALAAYLSGAGRDLAPAGVAATLQTGREAHGRRLAVVADGLPDVVSALNAFAVGSVTPANLTCGTASDDALDDLIGGAAGAAFVQTLMEARDLMRLGRLWCRGVGVDWQGLRVGPRPAPVWLPPYPFERMRCWLELDVPAIRNRPAVAVPPRAALLLPVWREARVPEAVAFGGRIALIGDGDWRNIADALGAELVASEATDGLIGRLEGFDAIVDAGLDAALDVRHELWRALAARRDGLRLLIVRPEGVAGAFGGGIAAALGGEYGALWSREMQIGGIGNIAPVALAAMLRAELGHDDGIARVLRRDGVRHRPTFDEVTLPSQPTIDLSMVGRGPVLITGGLGGLGMALARHLVTRGVKVLALTGLRPLQAGDARSLAVEALRARGATVEIYTGDLQNEAFQAFVAKLRAQHGPVRGAVHAAGRVGEGVRAYQSRSFAQVRAVMQPKIDGLHALRRSLGDDPLAFLVSYSSISAAIPSLAGGLIDYAAANAVLEAEARVAFAQGRRHERAIAWGNWTESGLGLAVSEKLQPLGLSGLSDAEGVALFEQALAVDAPVVLATGLRPDAVTDVWSLSRGVDAVTARTSTVQSTVPAALPSTTDRSAAMLSWLSGVFGRELRLPVNELDAERRFEDYGIDSILLADLVLALERELGVKLEPGLLIEHRTLRQLSAHLATLHAAPGGSSEAIPQTFVLEVGRSQANLPVNATPTTDRRVAVIGLACDFPGAPDAQRFWENLSSSVDAITEVPADRWDIGQFYDPAGGPGRSAGKWGGFIDGIALFDPAYFGIAPEDAASLDPLVRKALEIAVQTLRGAGYTDAEVKGSRTGVFVGARMSDYGARATTRRKRALTGSAQNFIAAQIAHCLDLHGPNLVVDTACSSSLTAVHLAVRSLIDGDSELALAGGVDLLLDETPYLGLTAGQALSPNGRCRTFDENADGFVPGEGAGMVLLKRLDRALADGDRVLAVIEGSAVNNDGRTMGLTTPNPEAQEQVIRQALTSANADPRTVSYVEAHGTGTMIGDPIELKALWRALGDDGERGRCAVGAVKSNIGHLLSAAGIASLIKVVLMLRHRTLAPTLHCQTPNPRFAFDRSPLRPVTRAEPWQDVDGVRRAGVSSFGFGGTNVHVVLSDHGVPAHVALRSSLSPQVFNRQRYWIEKTVVAPAIAAQPSPVHPAALPLREVASANGRHFVTTLPSDHPILRDHVVQGVGIAPGTMHFDLVHRALAAIDGQAQAGMALRHIVFREPAAIVPGAARRLDLALSPRAEGWDVEVTGGPDANIHLQAVAVRTMPQLGAAISVADLQAQAIASFDLADAYALARKVGIEHGDFMRARGTVWEGADFMLARLSVSDVAKDAAPCFALHPALLDALCLIPFLFERHRATAETRPFIPISIGAFEVSGALPTEGWVLVRRAGAGGMVPDDVYHADIGFYRADGTPAARMTRLAAKRIRVPLSVAADKAPTIVASAAASVVPSDASESALRDWLTRHMSSVLGQPIAGDAMEVGFYDLGLDSRQLLEAVRVLERGLGEDLYPTLLFEQGSIGRLAAYLWTEHRAGVGRLLASGPRAVTEPVDSAPSGPIPARPEAPAHTLYIAPNWSLAAIRGRRGLSGQILQSGQALNVSWPGGFTSDPKMAAGALFGWRGRQDVAELLTLSGRLPGDATLVVAHGGGPEGAGLRGLLVSVSRERPTLRLVSVERTDAAVDLTAELDAAATGFVAVRYRGGARETLGFAELELADATLPSGGAWLITGGLGQLGLHVARALTSRGARVGLVGRNAPTPELAAELADLGIVWTTGDVSDRNSLQSALDTLRSRLGPFTGVIHAAGVLRDGLAVVGLAEDDVIAVLAPKIVGAEHLDALTRHDPLQHFVLFSSATGSLGNVGQGVYAYANGWLDGFAATRSGPGRTLSVGWPLWAAGGMRGDATEAARHGVVSLDTQTGLKAFGAALAGEAQHVVVLHGDAARLRADLRLDATGQVSPAVHRRAVGTARTDEPIAVIGLAGRYPGAKDLDAFWQNLACGVDAVTEVPKERWDHAAYFDAAGEAAGTSWSRWGGFIDGVDQFDPLFFHIAPREARVMDPQERLFLEMAWAAMEDAAVSRETLAGRKVGVFAGVMWSQYQLYGLAAAKEGSHLLPMSFNSSVANRVSHVLDLRGPSLSLDTACSSSLTALHLAVESLRRGECELAFAGGVNLTLHPSKYQFLGQGRMLSSDGRCRAFGEGGDGYVPGEGVGVALLKPLWQAKADGDPVWGVILASGISHGGRTAGYTVPSAGRQQELIREVLAGADIKPSDISYIEAHGTGTSLGDPIEVEGLKGAFGAKSAEPWCALGSVKSNIGHLESAAGIAGLTKVLLQLRHRQLAPTLHADPLNSHLAIAGTPFRVQDRLAPWHADGRRIAGLSSFGAGGANAHLLICEAPDEIQATSNKIATWPELIVLSARTPAALRQRASDLLQWMDRAVEPVDVAVLAATLQTGRSPMAERLAFIASSADDIRTGLRAFVSGQTPLLDMQAPQAETARRFLAGASVDWDAVRPSRYAQRIGSLPTYPFERKRYWTDSWLDSAPPRAAGVVETNQDADTFRALRKRWHHAPLTAASGDVRPDGLIVLAGPASRPLSALLAPDAVVPMLQGWDEGKAAAENLLSFNPGALTVIDLADLDAHAHGGDELPLGRIAFLQTLIQQRPKDLRLLHLTQGMADVATLKGAVMAGLVRMLGAEHPGIMARTVDADIALDDGAAWMRILADELGAEDAGTEVRLRNGERFVPVMEAGALDAGAPLQCESDAAYLITGGTSGIGLTLAHTLVDAGATKLALMGRQSLPAADDWARIIADNATDPRLKDKLMGFAALRDRGVDILVHGGALTEAAGIAAFLARVRAELGPLAGLIHAAGLIEETRPRFIDKRVSDFVRIAEPKIAGLNTLLVALAPDRLRFAVLCSSIAAVVPSMAAGMSDYALANAYMDALAQHRAGRDDGTLWLSLQWVGWSEAGMHTRFDATVERIVRDGLGAHGLLFCDNAAGASLFARALAAGIPGPVIPAPVHVERLELALPKLLAVSRPPIMQTMASQSAPIDDAAVSALSDEELDRMLAAFDTDEAESDQDNTALEARIELVRRVVADVLELDLEEFGPDVPFRDVGIDSIAAVRVVRRLEESGLTITPRMLIDHPTPRALVLALHPGMREAAE